MLPHVSVESFQHSMQNWKIQKSAYHAQYLHAYICKYGLQAHRTLGNYLVSMLVEAGRLCDARRAFDGLLFTSECSWDSLINSYIKCGKSGEALTLCRTRRGKSVQVRGHTLVALVKVCAEMNDLEMGSELHTQVALKGSLKSDPFVGSALVDMYAKCGSLAKAQEVFNMLPVRDIVTWTALISAYAQHELGEKALYCFEEMQLAGISPNSFTFVCILKACGSIRALERGSEIHTEVEKRGLLKTSPFVGSAVVDMYAKCGMLRKAREVFDILPVRGVVTWTALIAGYAQQELAEEALKCFEQMQSEGVHPNSVTFTCTLKACGTIGDANRGSDIHSEIAKKGLLKGDLVLGNALVDMYAKCGMLAKAQEVFDNLGVRDAATWNALITGYVKQGLSEEALICYEQMCSESISPDAVTLSCILKACGNLGAIKKAGDIHAEVSKKGLLKTDLVVGNGLVDMYAKCGLLDKAQEAFDKLPVRDIVSWNSLIAGYAQLGESENVFLNFDRMVREEENPNQITFGSILNACIHAGLVFQGQTYLHSMFEYYGITPTIELHTCVIDLLGRAGQLDRAIVMSQEMPVHPTLVVWNTVLGACRKWGNVELGKQVFDHAVGLEEKDSAAYVCMYNIYADADMLEEATKVEAMRIQKQAWESHGENWWS